MPNTAVIDNLPGDVRKQIVNDLMAGVSFRKVSLVAGVTPQAIGKYYRKYIKPAMVAAVKAKQFQSDTVTTREQVIETGRLARDIVRASPVRERVDYIWDLATETMRKASESNNIAGMVELIDKAHDNIKLLGTLTGELQQNQHPAESQNNVNIILGIPRSGDTQLTAIEPTRRTVIALPAHDAADVSPDD